MRTFTVGILQPVAPAGIWARLSEAIRPGRSLPRDSTAQAVSSRIASPRHGRGDFTKEEWRHVTTERQRNLLENVAEPRQGRHVPDHPHSAGGLAAADPPVPREGLAVA